MANLSYRFVLTWQASSQNSTGCLETKEKKDALPSKDLRFDLFGFFDGWQHHGFVCKKTHGVCDVYVDVENSKNYR